MQPARGGYGRAGLFTGGGGGHGPGKCGRELFRGGTGGGAVSWRWPFRYPPCLPRANLHPESSIISKCKMQMRAIKDIDGAVWQKHSGLSRA